MKKKILKIKKKSKNSASILQASIPPSELSSKNLKENEKWTSKENPQQNSEQISVAVPFDEIAAKIEMKPEKRKPGRPKGSKNAVDAEGNSLHTAKESVFGSASSTSTDQEQPKTSGAMPVSQIVSSGIPPKILLNALQTPFAIAAARTGCSEIALSKEEGEPLVPMLDATLGKWMPSVLGVYGTEVMLGAGLISIAFVKWNIYQEFKAKKMPVSEVRKETVQNAVI